MTAAAGAARSGIRNRRAAAAAGWRLAWIFMGGVQPSMKCSAFPTVTLRRSLPATWRRRPTSRSIELHSSSRSIFPPGLAGELLTQVWAGLSVPHMNLSGKSRAITANTRVIVASHVAYVNGLVLPIKELADLAHRKGLLISVDGAQSFGVLPLDVAAVGLDHYAAPGQKWLLAGTGTGFTYVKKELQDKVQPLMGNYSAEGRRGAGGPPVRPSAHRYEQNGQYNIPAALGIGTALDLQLAIGKANIEARARELATRLRRGLQEIRGVKLATSTDPRFAANLTTFALGDQPPQDIAKALQDRAGIVVRTVKTENVNGIRVSTHFYNHPDEVDRLLGVVRALAA